MGDSSTVRVRAGPVLDPRKAQLRSGHTEITSRIVLDADVVRSPSIDGAAERLETAWPLDRGHRPEVERVPASGFEARLAQLTNLPTGPSASLCRVLLAPGRDGGRVGIVAHHAALDGLGLVATLGIVLGEPLGTSARGLAAPTPPARAGVAYGLRRLGEAVFLPPSRIAPEGSAPPASGDHLVRMIVECASVSTAVVISAAARAVRRWNAAHDASATRLVVAVGASRESGRASGLTPRSAWFRLPVGDPNPEVIRGELSGRTPEPVSASFAVGASPVAWLARRLSRRTGSTLLVSNLARLSPAGSVREAAFYPMAHGRSGVSVGCLTVADRTVLTLRARRSDFSEAAAGRLLAWVSEELTGPGAR